MGKTAKPKKARKVSIHSRAARRATSPSIDTDKSLKNAALPKDGGDSLYHYHDRHGGGVTKRRAKISPLKRQKRLRKEKDIQRAEAVLDQLERKVEKSQSKGRSVKGRRHDWEDVNDKLGVTAKVKAKTRVAKMDEAANGEWEDVDGEESDEEVAAAVTALKVTDAAEKPNDASEEEEIL